MFITEKKKNNFPKLITKCDTLTKNQNKQLKMKALDQLIRPARQTYALSDLGPTFFALAPSQLIKRHDIFLKNLKSQTLACSYYEPLNTTPLICFLYLHSNSGSRLEATPLITPILQRKCLLFCFDFAGSGLSEGKYISMGYFERDDVHCVIEYIEKQLKIKKIVLWGRSMGAATALFDDFPVIMKVLDSPFIDLKELIGEIIEKKGVPGLLVPAILEVIQAWVKKKAGYELENVKYIEKNEENSQACPLVLLGAKKDQVVSFKHYELIMRKYKGEVKWIELGLEHNEARPEELIKKIVNFVIETSKLTGNHKKKTSFHCTNNSFQKKNDINNSNKFVNFNDKYHLFKQNNKKIGLTGIRLMKDSPENKHRNNKSVNNLLDNSCSRPRAITVTGTLEHSSTKRENLTPYKVKEVVLNDDFSGDGFSFSFEKDDDFIKKAKKNTFLKENDHNVESFGDYFREKMKIYEENNSKTPPKPRPKLKFKAKIMKILKENKIVETKTPTMRTTTYRK